MAADLEQMKQKYASVLNLINQSGVRLSHMHIQDNKFFLQGAAGSEPTKNRILDQIKMGDPSGAPVAAAAAASASGGVSSGKGRTYTVAAGDSLSKIAKNFYGNAGQYM